MSLLLAGRCEVGDLGIDILKLVENLSKLSFADLEYDLLLLVFACLGFVFLQVHFDIQSGLLQSLDLFRRYLDIHPPIEVSQLWQGSELILVVCLGALGYLTHHLENERSDLFRECLWELGGKLVLILQSNVFLQEGMQRQDENQGFFIGDVQGLWETP